MENDLIYRKDAYESLLNGMVMTGYQSRALDCIAEYRIPAVDAVEVDTVCEMMEFLMGDSCPCNYNSIDEWLPYVCEQQEECPKPADKYGCWKQFIKHFGQRREDGDGDVN